MTATPERALLRRLVAWADSTAGIVAWTPTQALTDIVYPAVIIAEDARALLADPSMRGEAVVIPSGDATAISLWPNGDYRVFRDLKPGDRVTVRKVAP